MKSFHFIIIIILKFSLCKESNPQNVQNLVETYMKNPQLFLQSHNNKDNFIAIFTNFTRLNGEVIYNKYMNKNKDMQSLIDSINNYKYHNLDNWDFDPVKKKFILSEDSIILFK